MWEVVAAVGSGLTLVAFVVAAVTALLRRRLLTRERQLVATPEADRGQALQAVNDAFLIPALAIDPTHLTPDQRYTLLLEQVRDRARRFYVTAFVISLFGVATLIATLIAIAGSQNSPVDPRSATESQATSDTTLTANAESLQSNFRDFPVKVHRLHDAPDSSQRLASLLRQNGFSVNIIEDADLRPGQAHAKENYSVIWIGKKVPVTAAARAIRLTHLSMPWVKYVLLQYQDPKWDSHIFVNAHDEWASYLGLKPLSEVDFQQLSNEKISEADFHRLMETFRE